MSVDISGFGGIVTITAIPTYLAPIILTQFADDTDPFDIPELVIAETTMGNNGEQVGWSKANNILITLGIIPSSIDDEVLSVLFENNRVGKGKLFSTRDIITLTCVYPSNGKFINLINGRITKGMPGTSWSSAGRFKSKTYTFSFENKIGS